MRLPERASRLIIRSPKSTQLSPAARGRETRIVRVDYPLTALISDLHANQPALEVALADARARGAERYVCLGDVIGYGARPRECLDWVISLCAETPRDPLAQDGARALQPGLCLLGNHEYALLHSAEDFNPKARAAIEWTREELNRGEHRDANYGYWEFLDALVPSKSDARANRAARASSCSLRRRACRPSRAIATIPSRA